MKATTYFDNLKENIGKINPIGDTYQILERLIESINISPDIEVTSLIQVGKDPIPTYKGLVVESMLATPNSISDIIIGVNYLRYNTVPLSKINKIAFGISPKKVESTQIETYNIYLNIFHGSENQVFFYVSPVGKLLEFVALKKQLDKLICK